MARSYLVNAVDVELAAPVAAPDLTITVDDAAPLPTVPFYLVVDPFSSTNGREYMLCTNVAGVVLTVTRSLDGSEADTHPAGDVVRISYVAQILDDLWDEIENVSSLPAGGVIGDSLRKESSTDGDADWRANVTLDIEEPTSPILGDIWMDPDAVLPSATFLRLDGTSVMTGPLIHAAGSESAPSLSFAAEPTTGIYQGSAATISFSISGTRRLLLTSVGLSGLVTGTPGLKLDAAGTAATPAYGFVGDPGLGIYRADNDELSFAVLATPKFTLTSADAAFATNVTFPAYGEIGLRYDNQGISLNLGSKEVADDGVIPFIDFFGGSEDISARIILSAKETGASRSGGLRYEADQGHDFVGPVLASSGSAAAPGVSFRDQNTTGIYLNGTEGFGITSSGVQSAEFKNTDILFGAGHANNAFFDLNSSVSAANPTYSFFGYRTTGFYIRAANSMGVAVGGVDLLWLDPSGFYIRIAPSTGVAANAYLDGSNKVWKSTSARKYKSQITYDVSELLDIELKPAKFYREDDERWFYGQIADDLEEQDDIFAQYGEDGELENYDSNEVLAVVIAQLNDAKARIEVLENA